MKLRYEPRVLRHPFQLVADGQLTVFTAEALGDIGEFAIMSASGVEKLRPTPRLVHAERILTFG